jgi:antitoxin (DNA-binding transcriptional repressor) of toxin-antitoxin stability system
MPVVNMHEAKTHLAELVRRVQQGETFIIARAGRPMAQLIRLGGSPLPRRPGSLAGVIRMDEEVGMPAPAQIHRPAARGLRVVATGGPQRALRVVATPKRALRALSRGRR